MKGTFLLLETAAKKITAALPWGRDSLLRAKSAFQWGWRGSLHGAQIQPATRNKERGEQKKVPHAMPRLQSARSAVHNTLATKGSNFAKQVGSGTTKMSTTEWMRLLAEVTDWLATQRNSLCSTTKSGEYQFIHHQLPEAFQGKHHEDD